MISDKQRAMMAADLCERAAHEARSSGVMSLVLPLLSSAGYVANEHYPAEYEYRRGLARVGLTPEAIDAAVAAIRDGKHPVDSLAGQVEEMRALAELGVNEHEEGTPEYHERKGTEETACTMLDLLGVKP